MSSASPKRVLFEQFANVAKAAAHPLRLELLEQLAQGERSVEVLADRTRVSIANASQHLQQLRRAGLITPKRELVWRPDIEHRHDPRLEAIHKLRAGDRFQAVAIIEVAAHYALDFR